MGQTSAQRCSHEQGGEEALTPCGIAALATFNASSEVTDRTNTGVGGDAWESSADVYFAEIGGDGPTVGLLDEVAHVALVASGIDAAAE